MSQVDTVKRMCVKKLPPMLAIQLKRFDYDWERSVAIPFLGYLLILVIIVLEFGASSRLESVYVFIFCGKLFNVMPAFLIVTRIRGYYCA